MKSDTRKAKMASIFEDDAEDLLKLLPKEKSQEELNEEHSQSREAEAVLALLHRTRFEHKICKECEGDFLTDYGCVAYCSDRCRAASLRKMGLGWDATKPLEERWGHPIPLIIPQALMDHLRKCLNLTPVLPVLPEPELPELPPVHIEPQTQLNEVPIFEEELDLSILDVLHT